MRLETELSLMTYTSDGETKDNSASKRKRVSEFNASGADVAADDEVTPDD